MAISLIEYGAESIIEIVTPGPAGPPGDSIFADRAALAAASVPSPIIRVYTKSYSVSAGSNGGAWYKRVAAQPSHSLKVQDALLAWWEIDEPEIYAEQAGAIGDGITICTAAFQAAIDAVSARGGGRARFGVGQFLINGTLTLPSNVVLDGEDIVGSVIVVSSAMSTADPAIKNLTNSTDGSLTNTGIVCRNFTMLNQRTGKAWLSKADGTVISNPSADYLPGGCLAPTTQPTVTLTLTAGVITGYTITNGGAGVNFPVAIWITGDGEGADLRGTIAAGALTSITITNGGRNYTTATAVVAGGGADPVTALYAADRRNSGYTDGGGVAIQFTTCDAPVVERVLFKNFGGVGVVSDRGCDALVVRHCRFEDCGQIDYVGSCLWSQSFGTPGGGQAFFRWSTNTRFVNNLVLRQKRSAVTFGGKNQIAEANTIEGWYESCIYANENAENYTVRNNVASGGRISDILCSFAEVNQSGSVSGNVVTDCDGRAVAANSYSKTDVSNNVFSAVAAASKVKDYPFGPFSERVGFSTGTSPVAGAPRRLLERSAVSVEEVSAGADNRPKRCLISGNKVIDPDGSLVWAFTFAKGEANVIEGVSIVDNDLSDASLALLFDPVAASTALNLNKPFAVRDNIGLPEVHMLSNRSAYARSDAAGAQNIFSGPASVNLWGKSRYRIDGEIIITCGATAHDIGLGFSMSAALASIWYKVLHRGGALNVVSTTQTNVEVDTVAQTNFVSGATNTRHSARIYGIIETDAATTATPQFGLSGATTGAVAVAAQSVLRFTYDGPAGRASVGDVA